MDRLVIPVRTRRVVTGGARARCWHAVSVAHRARRPFDAAHRDARRDVKRGEADGPVVAARDGARCGRRRVLSVHLGVHRGGAGSVTITLGARVVVPRCSERSARNRVARCAVVAGARRGGFRVLRAELQVVTGSTHLRAVVDTHDRDRGRRRSDRVQRHRVRAGVVHVVRIRRPVRVAMALVAAVRISLVVPGSVLEAQPVVASVGSAAEGAPVATQSLEQRARTDGHVCTRHAVPARDLVRHMTREAEAAYRRRIARVQHPPESIGEQGVIASARTVGVVTVVARQRRVHR